MYFLLYSLKPLPLFEFIDNIFIISTHENESFIKSHQDFNNFHLTIHISLDLSTDKSTFFMSL